MSGEGSYQLLERLFGREAPLGQRRIAAAASAGIGESAFEEVAGMHTAVFGSSQQNGRRIFSETEENSGTGRGVGLRLGAQFLR